MKFIFLITLVFIASDLFGQMSSKELDYFESRKSPAVAGTLSFIIPGGGQFYANQPIKGVAFIAASGGVAYMITRSIKDENSTSIGVAIGGAVGLKIIDIIFAVSSAKEFNESLKKKLQISTNGISYHFDL